MFEVAVAHALTAPAQSGQGGGSTIGGFLMIALIILIFYFLLIRPQQKQQKASMQMRESLKKGDKIVTSGGIYGTIEAVNPKSVTLYVSDKVKIEVAKNSISAKREEQQSETKKGT
ncbi:MAG: preprotein translocase subunit YajC [bacterium]